MPAPPDKPATTSVPVHELIASRWSPRAFDPDAAVSDRQLRALLEAARWAPSFGNTQPARYLVGRRGDTVHAKILAALTERNRSWACRASALLLVVAMTENAKGTVPYATYSAGLATENLVLQATASGLAAHQMAGFDAEAARRDFALPDYAEPLVALAVGVQADAKVLGDENLAEREQAPRRRITLDELAFGEWGTPAFRDTP
ncbi:nitroreductase family protein [Haloechinothrix sp. YIM 98757]|uniref:Nitroreductase family protein n=1 Tax=Haloechinothrix aidingensis TaxID=2752311 RepID=A0A838AE55_9PSEU|nr:nitroreductase family protein [Haloechinothrix aidingensis]MBA0127435.1 nitroreductase family protein [Haloechinothrix aidingensis]